MCVNRDTELREVSVDLFMITAWLPPKHQKHPPIFAFAASSVLFSVTWWLKFGSRAIFQGVWFININHAGFLGYLLLTRSPLLSWLPPVNQ